MIPSSRLPCLLGRALACGCVLFLLAPTLRARVWEPGECPGCEIRGHWRVLEGFLQRSGSWTFRQGAADQAAVRVELPPENWLPRRQYLLKDGSRVLHWTEPESARPLLAEDSELLRSLEALPAPAWLAFLAGEDLAAFMTVESREERRGRLILVGELAGQPARLETGSGRCRRLLWGGVDGPLVVRWDERREARWRSLELRRRHKPLIRLKMRPPRRRELDTAHWLFLSE